MGAYHYTLCGVIWFEYFNYRGVSIVISKLSKKYIFVFASHPGDFLQAFVISSHYHNNSYPMVMWKR